MAYACIAYSTVCPRNTKCLIYSFVTFFEYYGYPRSSETFTLDTRATPLRTIHSAAAHDTLRTFHLPTLPPPGCSASDAINAESDAGALFGNIIFLQRQFVHIKSVQVEICWSQSCVENVQDLPPTLF